MLEEADQLGDQGYESSSSSDAAEDSIDAETIGDSGVGATTDYGGNP